MGSIHNFMVDKRSGKVAYAVMSFGGVLGIGGKHYPLPWDKLTYDTSFGGYVVDVPKERLESAPGYAAADVSDWSDPAYGRQVSGYWGNTTP